LVDFTVRTATQKDFPAIHALIIQVNINPIGLDWRRFLIAMNSENELLGCGQIKSHFDGSLELASIAVKEQARGQGVARTVIQELLKRETNRPLFLMCRARLEMLYVKFGFFRIDLKEMPPYFQRICRLERIMNFTARPENRLLVMRLH
jgi:N-acetylglutamate synthase-like GNAT family acetyltransferase